MKTGIDIRNFSHKKSFVAHILQNIQTKDNSQTYYIFTSQEIESKNPNIKIIVSKKKSGFFANQIHFFKTLRSLQLDFFITFEDTYPIFYKKNVFMVVPSLEKILYPDSADNTLFAKYSFLFSLKNNFKNAKKIICYNKKTKKEINEKLNIHDDKIEIVTPFFTPIPEPTSKIDIKAKHSLAWEYFIYDAGNGNNKNLKRIFEAISDINHSHKISLIIIGEHIAHDIELRSSILHMGLKDYVIFAGRPNFSELWLYYKNSLGVIQASLYESFPDNLNKAVAFGTPILASNIPEIKDIFGNTIDYFSPISVWEMVQAMKKRIKMWVTQTSYESIKKHYQAHTFVKELLALIK